jgi:hypothetical protein
LDKFESQITNYGLIQAYDPELKQQVLIDTDSADFINKYQNWLKSIQTYLNFTTKKNNVDLIKFNTGDSYIVPLQKFFKLREWRRKS